MRSIVMALALMISFGFQSVNASADASQPAQNLFSQLQDSSWVGKFHFEVYGPSIRGPVLVKRSADYDIEVLFNTGLTAEGQIPYFFSKDVSMAEGFDKFAFEKIDAPACPNEPRMIEVSSQNKNIFSGVVHAPSCKDGKRTIKDLPVKSLEVIGDTLRIVIADNVLGENLSFRIVYKLLKTGQK